MRLNLYAERKVVTFAEENDTFRFIAYVKSDEEKSDDSRRE